MCYAGAGANGEVREVQVMDGCADCGKDLSAFRTRVENNDGVWRLVCRKCSIALCRAAHVGSGAPWDEHRFSVGDVVRCVDASDDDSGFLDHYGVYRVVAVSDVGLDLARRGSRMSSKHWMSSRFELIDTNFWERWQDHRDPSDRADWWKRGDDFDSEVTHG